MPSHTLKSNKLLESFINMEYSSLKVSSYLIQILCYPLPKRDAGKLKKSSFSVNSFKSSPIFSLLEINSCSILL